MQPNQVRVNATRSRYWWLWWIAGIIAAIVLLALWLATANPLHFKERVAAFAAPVDASSFAVAPTANAAEFPIASNARTSLAPTAATAPTAMATPAPEPTAATSNMALAATPAPACGNEAHQDQIAKFNAAFQANGKNIQATLKAMGVQFNEFDVVTTGSRYEMMGDQIVGIHFFPASGLHAPWPFVLATPDRVDLSATSVDIGGGNKIYREGTLIDGGGGVLWVSGQNYPELCP